MHPASHPSTIKQSASSQSSSRPVVQSSIHPSVDDFSPRFIDPMHCSPSVFSPFCLFVCHCFIAARSSFLRWLAGWLGLASTAPPMDLLASYDSGSDQEDSGGGGGGGDDNTHPPPPPPPSSSSSSSLLGALPAPRSGSSRSSGGGGGGGGRGRVVKVRFGVPCHTRLFAFVLCFLSSFWRSTNECLEYNRRRAQCKRPIPKVLLFCFSIIECRLMTFFSIIAPRFSPPLLSFLFFPLPPLSSGEAPLQPRDAGEPQVGRR